MTDEQRELQVWKPATKECHPLNGEKVLVWYARGAEKNYRPIFGVVFGFYIKELRQWRIEGGNGDFSDLITHWMPLPCGPVCGDCDD